MMPIERAALAMRSCRTCGQVWVANKYALLAIQQLPKRLHPLALETLDELTDRQLHRISGRARRKAA